MKKTLIVIGFLIFAVLMLPGIIHPPAESSTGGGSEVRQLSRALIAALLDYRKEYGKFPEGGEAEIMGALCGKNEKGAIYIEPAPSALDAQGAMLDPWGTPFRITFDETSHIPKIHSAGPNRKFENHPSKHGDDYRSWVDDILPL